jgi:hypothetical protein
MQTVALCPCGLNPLADRRQVLRSQIAMRKRSAPATISLEMQWLVCLRKRDSLSLSFFNRLLAPTIAALKRIEERLRLLIPRRRQLEIGRQLRAFKSKGVLVMCQHVLCASSPQCLKAGASARRFR